MQTYVAEIDGRAIFAFRAGNDANAQAWLDIHAVMRHTLETLHSGGHRIWNGASSWSISGSEFGCGRVGMVQRQVR
jgi:hypothetical protein